MSLIVYADFVCPECYLASRRADALLACGVELDWRAVEHDQRLTVGPRRLPATEQDALAQRLAALQELLLAGETLPAAIPTIEPGTEAAVSAYAEAYGAGVGDDVRRLLFELYWRGGVDINSPALLRTSLAGPMLRGTSTAEPLRESGYAVTVDRGPVTTSAFRRIRAWRADWLGLGRPALPVVLTDGATLSGLDALRRLGKEISYVGAHVDPELADPRRYPQITGTPQAAWVSQIGGRWRTSYRSSGTRDPAQR